MMRRFIGHLPSFALGWVLFGTLGSSVAASAQGPGGPPPPMDGPPPPFGRPAFGRPGAGPPPPPATVARTPIALLGAKLKLTADQNARITQIQSGLRRQTGVLMPRPGRRPVGPPPRPGLQEDRRKVRALDEAASQKITALLTAAQKKSLPGVLAEMDALRADGLPLQIYGDLGLTAGQETRLIAIGQAARSRQQTDTRVAAVLTATQRRVLVRFRRDHPRPGPGLDGPPPPLSDDIGPPRGF